MKKISLKDLKENLSTYAEEAAKGDPIQVTKYNKPFILLLGSSGTSSHFGLHIGKNAGKASLESVGKTLSKGKVLDVLSEDRSEEYEP